MAMSEVMVELTGYPGAYRGQWHRFGDKNDTLVGQSVSRYLMKIIFYRIILKTGCCQHWSPVIMNSTIMAGAFNFKPTADV